MNHVTVKLVPVVIAALHVASPRLASACGPLSVEAEPRVLTRWPDLPARVRSAFADRVDIDACARVKLALRQRFHVEVTLPDGRVAEREVPHVEDVVPSLEALLVVPAAATEATEPEVAAPPTTPPPVEASASVTAPSPRPHSPRPQPPAVVLTTAARPPADSDAPAADRGRDPPRSTRPVRLELSGLVDARTGGGPLGLGFGLLGFADMSSWLVGLGGRADHYASMASSRTTLSLSALGGRRFRWGEDMAIDLVGGPALLVSATGVGDVQAEVSRNSNGPPPPPPPDEDDTMTAAHLAAAVRLHFRMRSSLRTFVGVDGEVGPGVGPAASRVPVATIGLALGATVGAR